MKNLFLFLVLLCGTISILPDESRAQWVQTNGPCGGYTLCLTLSPNGAGGMNLFAGTYGGGVFLSTNSGTHWTAVNNGLDDPNVWAIVSSPDGAGGTDVFAGTLNKGVYRSTNNGANWTAANSGLCNITLPQIFSFAVVLGAQGGTNLFAGTSSGIFLSTDNGNNWKSVNNGFLQPAEVFSFVVSADGNGGTNLYAGIPSGVYVSNDNGANWTDVSYGLPAGYTVSALAAIPNAAGGTSIFAGTDVGLYSSIDNGAHWNPTSLTKGVRALLACPNGTNGSKVFAGSEGGGVFLSADYGNTWTPVNTGLSTAYLSALTSWSTGAPSTTIFAASYQDGVFRTMSDGADWTPVNDGLVNDCVSSLAITPNGSTSTNLFAGTDHHGVLLSTNDGETWNQVNNGLGGTRINGIAFGTDVTGGTNLFVATDAGVFLSPNSGFNWAPKFGNAPPKYVTSISATGTNVVIGVAGEGIYYSADNGASWYPGNSGMPNNDIESLVAVNDGTRGVEFFAGTNGGWVCHSTDYGASWNAYNIGVSQTQVTCLATCGKYLFAGTQSFGVYLSSDDGQTWTYTASPQMDNGIHALAVSGQNLFAGTEQGGFWLSKDCGATWNAVNTGFPGSPWRYTRVPALIVSDANLFAGSFSSGVWRRPLSEMISTPPTVTTTAATNITSSSATLNGTVNPNGSATSAYFEWGTDNTLSTSNSTASQSIGSGTADVSVTADLTGLSPNTTYYYRVIGENSAGVQRGSILSFKTLTLTPEQVIQRIIDQIKSFVATRVLTNAQGKILELPLDLALQALQNGRNGIAIVELRAFIVEAQLYLRLHLLTSAQAQPLIDDANLAIDLIKSAGGNLAVSSSEEQGILSKAAEVEEIIVPGLRLSQNNPNPFNPSTQIQFTVPAKGHASLSVFNTLGQKVATLFEGEAEAGQIYETTFNATTLPSGLYFARFEFGGKHLVRKMLLVK